MTTDLEVLTADLAAMQKNQTDINAASVAVGKSNLTPAEMTIVHNALAKASGDLNATITETKAQIAELTPPVVTPPAPTFEAVATSDTVATVTWGNVSPVLLARNGSDSTGGGAWNTGPLTGEPTSGSSTFTLLIPGDDYEFTLTEASGATLTASVTMPAAPVVVTPPVTPPPPVVTPKLKMAIGSQGAVLRWPPANYPPLTEDSEPQLVQEMGGSLFRFDITWNGDPDGAGNGHWPGLELTPGVRNAALIPVVVELVNRYRTKWGINPILIFDLATPLQATWTSGAPCTPQQYADGEAWFIQEMKNAGVTGLLMEQMNEPDREEVPVAPALYAQAVKLANAAMKVIDPTEVTHAMVVGNLAPAAWSGGSAYIAEVFAAGLIPGVDFDKLSIHPYNQDQDPTLVNEWGQTYEGMFTEYLFPVLAAANCKVPISATEFGHEISATCTLQQQADWLTAEMSTMDSLGVTEALVYQLLDSGDTYGISNGPGDPKLAYTAIQALKIG